MTLVFVSLGVCTVVGLAAASALAAYAQRHWKVTRTTQAVHADTSL